MLRRLGALTRLVHGLAQRTAVADQFDDASDPLETAFADRSVDEPAFFRSQVLAAEDQGQGRFAFGQVVADVLPQRRGLGGIVQDVIGHLEGGAEFAAESREVLFTLFAAGQDA